jgi:hypothetical protein
MEAFDCSTGGNDFFVRNVIEGRRFDRGAINEMETLAEA